MDLETLYKMLEKARAIEDEEEIERLEGEIILLESGKWL